MSTVQITAPKLSDAINITYNYAKSKFDVERGSLINWLKGLRIASLLYESSDVRRNIIRILFETSEFTRVQWWYYTLVP
jgi:hypothetical protein